jgi:hypothetical protein
VIQALSALGASHKVALQGHFEKTPYFPALFCICFTGMKTAEAMTHTLVMVEAHVIATHTSAYRRQQ